MGIFEEEVISDRDGGTVVFVSRPVELVRTRLRHKAHLRAGRSTSIRVRIAGRHAELFGRILRSPQNTRKGKPTHLIVVIHTVQRHIALIGTPPVHRSRAAVLQRRVRSRGNRNKKHTRVQRQKIGDIPRLTRQRLNRRVIGRVAQRSIRRIQGLRALGHVHDLVARLQRQRKINRGRLIDQQLGMLCLIAKPLSRNDNVVRRRRNLLKLVIAAGLRHRAEGLPGRLIPQRDSGSGNHRPTRIAHHPAQGRRGILRECADTERKNKRKKEVCAATHHRSSPGKTWNAAPAAPVRECGLQSEPRTRRVFNVCGSSFLQENQIQCN